MHHDDDLIKTVRMNYLLTFISHYSLKNSVTIYVFYLEDYALSEIAETFEVSRQAVYDNIRRTGDLVEDYEQKLGLYRRFTRRQEIFQQIRNHIHEPEHIQQYIQELEELE